ncbi:unnamed protein product [Citrullus colocynthis]|uniref:Uncharacterized protein n=1 Tax=Citrullus colocynthis TaxID=252529 RepID=A0ABP0YP42_9ROSI
MVNRTSSPSSSPVKITVSLESKGVSGVISMGLTAPISNDSNSPLSGRGNRRPNCSKFSSMSKDEVLEQSNTEFVTYNLHIPPTPNHHSISDSQITLPEDNANMGKRQMSFISSTIFTGGFDSVTRGHVIESLANPTKPIKLGPVCEMEGCDEKTLKGKTMVPCECGFNICRDCYLECVGNGVARCPGCKESCTSVSDDETKDQALPFETTGTYGHGNTVWQKDSNGFGSKANGFEQPPNFGEKSRRPLTWKVPVSPAILIPYR